MSRNRKADVQDFLSQKNIAIVGTSRSKNKFGNIIFRELKKRGYRVIPVNPNTKIVEGDQCYPDLKSLPEKVDGAIIVVPPANTIQVVKDARDAEIFRIWIQSGAYSKEAVDFCNDNKITVVANECILMFAEPVNSIHRIHRWIWKLLGKYPN